MEKRRCGACRKLFHPRPQSPGQKFCSAAQCQRERKRRWQKARRAADSDYRDNDIQASRQWRRRHPDYWRAYRRQHPRSVIRNRAKQRERDRSRRLQAPRPPLTPPLANEDASSLQLPFETGTYRMILVTGGGLANEGTDQNTGVYLYKRKGRLPRAEVLRELENAKNAGAKFSFSERWRHSTAESR